MPFQVFDKRSAAASKSPFVTLQKDNGPISLNKAAHDLIDNSEGVELLYDPDEKLIGFRPVELTNPRAFPVRPQNANATTLMVAGQAFTKHFGIDTRVARRYPVEVRDGILVLDLKGDNIEVVSNRGRKAGASE